MARELEVHVRTSYRWCWGLRNAALFYEMDRQIVNWWEPSKRMNSITPLAARAKPSKAGKGL
jgi:hypothetical protein